MFSSSSESVVDDMTYLSSFDVSAVIVIVSVAEVVVGNVVFVVTASVDVVVVFGKDVSSVELLGGLETHGVSTNCVKFLNVSLFCDMFVAKPRRNE